MCFHQVITNKEKCCGSLSPQTSFPQFFSSSPKVSRVKLSIPWICRVLNYQRVLDAKCQSLRAAVRKYRLGVCKTKKSKISKLCQNISLGKLFLEKELLVRLDFDFTRTATESVRRLSDQFSRAQNHILLKNRLKIKEVKNSASENLNRKNTT